MGKKKEVVIKMANISSAVEFLPYNPLNKEEIKKEDLPAIREYIKKYDKNLILNSFAQEPCTTPLHDVCNCVDTNEANEMLKIILDWYKDDPEPPKGDLFIHMLDQHGNNALHYAMKTKNEYAFKALLDRGAILYRKILGDEVKNGNFDELKKYVDNWGNMIKIASFDEGRTPLHDICECEDKEKAKRMLDEVINWYKGDEKDIKFFDKKDIKGNTALHYALNQKNRYAVNTLIDCGASVHIKNNTSEEAITKIYELYPKTIMALFDGEDEDKRFTFGKDEDQDDDDDDKLKITCDFGAVIGIDLDRSKVYETYLLWNVLYQKQTNQILDYPIVGAFLNLKWNRMSWLIYFSMAFHTIWSVLSSHIIWSIFMAKYENVTNNTELWEKLENEDGNLSNYEFNGQLIILLIFITLFMLVKEAVEFIETPRKIIYLKQMENWSQLLLITSIFVLMSNLTLSNFLPIWLDFNLSIVAVMTSCLLVLGQLNKQPGLGFYMAMFMEVLGNFGWLFLWFSPILGAFMVGLQMLMPKNGTFQLWLPFGLIKIVAMSTGEYEYDDLYDDGVDAIKIPKNILVFFFITLVGIVLSNLLIGLVVSDLESLQKNASVTSLATQLEQMYLMETFINKWLGWYPELAEACRVTGEPSFAKVWPLNWLNYICRKSGIKCLWESRKSNTSSATTSNPSNGEVSLGINNEEHQSNENTPLVAPNRTHQPNETIPNEQSIPAAATVPQKSSGSTSVASTEPKKLSKTDSHIIKATMKDFSEQSKIRLMELKNERKIRMELEEENKLRVIEQKKENEIRLMELKKEIKNCLMELTEKRDARKQNDQ